MHQKVNVLIFFNICPKKAVLKKSQIKSRLTILLSSLVFIFSSPKAISDIFIITTVPYHGPLVFPTKASLLPLSLQNPLDYVNE